METHNHSKVGPLRRIVGSLFLAAAVAAALGAVASSRAINRSSPEQAAALRKIAPWVTEHTAGGKQAEFMVVLADQADISGAAALSTKSEKGHFVRDALLNKSQATQAPILQWLQERGLEHRSFYIVNAILVKGSREIAETLAARADVARVEGNPQIKNSLPQPGPTVECAGGIERAGGDRAGHRLHKCAFRLGGRFHRTEYRHRQRRYRGAVDA